VNRVLLPDGIAMWIVENDNELKRNLIEFNKTLKQERKEREDGEFTV
jgi:hypothetical protein